MKALLIGALLGALAGGVSLARLKPTQPPPYGWELSCGDKPEARVWVDLPADPNGGPPVAVSASIYWSGSTDPNLGLWARAEGGGKVAVYASLPHGVYLWPAWTIGGVETFQSHATFCP